MTTFSRTYLAKIDNYSCNGTLIYREVPVTTAADLTWRPFLGYHSERFVRFRFQNLARRFSTNENMRIEADVMTCLRNAVLSRLTKTDLAELL